MTAQGLRFRADQAIRIATKGSISEIEAFESREGDSISMILDHLWSEALDRGMSGLADRLERAYDYVVTG